MCLTRKNFQGGRIVRHIVKHKRALLQNSCVFGRENTHTNLTIWTGGLWNQNIAVHIIKYVPFWIRAYTLVYTSILSSLSLSQEKESFYSIVAACIYRMFNIFIHLIQDFQKLDFHHLITLWRSVYKYGNLKIVLDEWMKHLLYLSPIYNDKHEYAKNWTQVHTHVIVHIWHSFFPASFLGEPEGI